VRPPDAPPPRASDTGTDGQLLDDKEPTQHGNPRRTLGPVVERDL
jgi:hypothetical protein